MSLLPLGCRSSQVSADEVEIKEELGSLQADSFDSESLDEAQADDSTQQISLTELAQVLPVAAQVELGGEVIDLEVTRTAEEQATGLMHRASLADDRGMLFRFEPARPVRFWMKNVVIDLDMIFAHQGEIVGISKDVPPCTSDPCATYGPGLDVLVDEVIELRGGRAAELGLAVGDAVIVQPLQ